MLRGAATSRTRRAGGLRLRNCPFHVLAEEHPLLVCSMNLALCRGLLEGLGEDPERARLDAASGGVLRQRFLKLMNIDIEADRGWSC